LPTGRLKAGLDETRAAGHFATAEISEATPEDIEWADAVVFGSATRFGNVSAQLKQFMDTLGGLRSQGKLVSDPGGALSAAESQPAFAGGEPRGPRPAEEVPRPSP
jgi:multimeric flavodoxin WrbA